MSWSQNFTLKKQNVILIFLSIILLMTSFASEADAASYTKKFNFSGDTNGSGPYGALTMYNGKFYGMTNTGGTYGKGTIFEWNPSNNALTTKIHFDETTKGAYPRGSLTLQNGKFYGMTFGGGLTDTQGVYKGVLFQWDPSTNVFTKIFNFNDRWGCNPYGSLTYYNGKFYGMTFKGGLYDKGVIFEYNPSARTYTRKVSFSRTITKGTHPMGDLVMNMGMFYGTTFSGGMYGGGDSDGGYGTIFTWNPLTNIFLKKVDFDGTILGKNPAGSLVKNGLMFYGTANMGGTFGYGTIFQCNLTATACLPKFHFNGVNGAGPFGSLVASSGGFIPGSPGKLYGTTSAGGAGSITGRETAGTIFAFNPLTMTLTSRTDLSTTLGKNPYGTLASYGGSFYGMTTIGGTNGLGVIFKWTP